MKTGKMMSLLVAAALLVGVAQMPGCSHDDTAIVTIQIANYDKISSNYMNPFLQRLFSFFITEAYAVSSNWTKNYQSIILVVEGEGMETITQSIPATSSSFSTEVPAGNQRKFTVYCSDSTFGKTWGGHAIADLDPNSEKTLSVTMFPMTKITSTTAGTSSVIINFDPVNSNYTGYVNGIKGYYLYRASTAGGSYQKVQTLLSTAYSATDSGLAKGTYYYKMSVYTNDGEGELCDYKSGSPL
jgi:hypothetical protein